jgi:hypothetical protein
MPIFLLTAWTKVAALFPAMVEFVLKYWKQCIVLGMAFVIYNQNFMEWQVLKWFGVQTVPALEKQLKLVTEEIDQCQVDKRLLKSQIELVNAQVDKWAEVSGQVQTQHNQLVLELAKLKQETEQTVQQILSEPTPQSCEEAIQYLKDASIRGELKWND